MIKVVEEMSGSALTIEVVGSPRQYQLRAGKVGTWTPKVGKNKGKVQTGMRWGRPSYHVSLTILLKAAVAEISEMEGIPETAISPAHAEAWQRLIDAENCRIAMLEKVGAEYKTALDRFGKQMKAEAGTESEVAAEPEPAEENTIDV